jgi:hypothetical protein
VEDKAVISLEQSKPSTNLFWASYSGLAPSVSAQMNAVFFVSAIIS